MVTVVMPHPVQSVARKSETYKEFAFKAFGISQPPAG